MEPSRTKIMSKDIIIVLLIPLIFAIILIWRLMVYTPANPNIVDLKIKDQNYKIELATTNAQRTKGLSQRQTLCPNCGMLFIFNFETYLPFWMKDTLIPLDMIWLNKSGQIVDIKTVTETNSQKIYQNQTTAKYVLELNANDSQKIGLKIGDIIDLSKVND